MNPLRVTLWQTDIAWEDKSANLDRLRLLLEELRGQTELVVLPETFSTGFSMHPAALAESVDGPTLTSLRQWAATYGVAIAGSYIACNTPHDGHYRNRAFFLTPEGDAYYYDKRHLFRMGRETEYYAPGHERLIVHYRGWAICLLVCYDLRFPVWSRNRRNEYDLLIYVANWPASRRKAWDILLQARAVENISYVCGVNRVGDDLHGVLHDGGTAAWSPRGERMASIPDHATGTVTLTLDGDALQRFRERFPAWKDADEFTII